MYESGDRNLIHEKRCVIVDFMCDITIVLHLAIKRDQITT